MAAPRPGGEGDEALLGAVVEVALDAPPLGFGAVDGGRAARLQALHLGGVGGVGARPEQRPGEGDVHPRHADRDPRSDEDEAGESDQQRRQRHRRPG